MLDLKEIREAGKQLEELVQRKEPTASLASIVTLDKKHREKLTELERQKAEKNRASSLIGKLKQEGKGTEELLQEVASLTESIRTLQDEVKSLESELAEALASIPNAPLEDIPISQNPSDNQEIRRFGEKRAFTFPFKNHLELAEGLDLLDFARGSKMSGAGWPIYKGWGARLEWALVQFMLNTQIKNGFTPYLLPHLVRKEMMQGVGQLPKFESQLFKIHDEDYHLYLIPTAEAALNALHFDEILEGSSLPRKYCAYSPCFRREAGAAGEKERGLIRMHQFNKVEMFAFTTPEESGEMFDAMVTSAENVLQALGLHFRSMLLVTGDMSFAAVKTVDIEVFLPGQDRYYEVSSVSNCSDYQARRSKIRFKRAQNDKPELVHTLNGSGLATSRLMVALLENYQQEDGSVVIPEVLRPYLDGIEVLKKPSS